MNDSERWDVFYKKAVDKTVWGGERADFFDEIRAKYHLTGGLLLDVGCGLGDKSLYFARYGYETIGIDISQQAINEATKRALTAKARSQFLVGDFRKIRAMPEISGKIFDVVLDILSSQFLPDQDRKEFAREISMLVKPNGYYFLETFGRKDEQDQLPDAEEWIKNIAISPEKTIEYYGDYFDILERGEKKSANREGSMVHFYVMRRKVF